MVLSASEAWVRNEVTARSVSSVTLLGLKGKMSEGVLGPVVGRKEWGETCFRIHKICLFHMLSNQKGKYKKGRSLQNTSNRF